MSKFQELLKKLDEDADTISDLKQDLKKVEGRMDKEHEKVSEYLKKRGN